MPKYINVAKQLVRLYRLNLDCGDVIKEFLVTAEPEEVMEVKHGRWIWMGEKGDSRFMCSMCKSKENVPTIMGKPEVWWFCPNCGADMRKERKNEL